MNRKNWRTAQQRGYTLIEIMIVITVLTAATVGVLRFFQQDSAKASVQQEQTNLAAMVQTVDGLYATRNSFAGVSSADLLSSRVPGIRRDQGNLLSAFGSTIAIQPATVLAANDAFQVIYGGLDASQCAGLIPAVAGDAYAISIAGGASVVSTNAATLGKITDPGLVASQCAGTTFGQHTGSVALTYYRTGRATGAPPPPGCTVSCSPQTQTQTLACPTGQVGEINQTRSSTCSAGACPTQVWSAWTSTSSSCAIAPIAPPPPVTPPPPVGPPPACTPATTQRNQACPAGQSGIIVETQTRQCPSGAMTPWTTVSSTCATVVTSGCVAGSNSRNQACPAGQGGQITQMQNFTCDPTGNPVPGSWFTVSDNCSTTGTCRPSTAPDGQRNVACSAGQYGQIVQQLQKSSTCSSPTAAPIWGPDQVASATGSCTACPAATTQSQTIACPAGQTGSTTQERSMSYACASAPTTLPAPTYGAWSTTASTCTSTSCTPSAPAATLSAMSIAYDTDNTQDPPVTLSGTATFTISEGGYSATYTTGPNTGGTDSMLAAVNGYTYTMNFTCKSHTGERGGRGGGNSLQTWVTCVDPVIAPCAAVNTCSPSGGGAWSVNVLSMTTGPFNSTPTATYPIVTTGDRTVMKLGATTSRFLASGSITFDMTVGAQTQQFTVACTQANSTLNTPGNHITDECQYMGLVNLNGVSLNVAIDACGLVAQDWVNGSAVSCTSQVTIDQGGCTPPPAPQPVTNFEVGFWGGYWWNGIKPSDPSLGTCNAPVDGTNPTSGGSTGFNSFVLLNTPDGSADHYIVTMTRKGVTKTVTIPASKITKNPSVSTTQPDGRAYWYQSPGGIFDTATVYALTPDIDWSQYDYHDATTNGGGGITITPDFRAATVSITACNAAGQCSAPTTETEGISIFSDGERDCQALSGGAVTPYPPTAVQ